MPGYDIFLEGSCYLAVGRGGGRGGREWRWVFFLLPFLSEYDNSWVSRNFAITRSCHDDCGSGGGIS